MAEKLKKIEFDFLYARDAEKLAFYQLPKLLFENDCFRNLDLGAKVMYSICLDRASLSIKNSKENGSWIDKDGHIYIYYTIKEMQEDLQVGKNKAINLKKQLIDIGLLINKKQGLNKPDRLYVLDYSSSDTARKFKNQTSGGLKNKPQEVPENKPQKVLKTNSNNTNINKTKRSFSPVKEDALIAWETIIDGRNRFSSNKNKAILDMLDDKAKKSLRSIGGITKLRNCDAFEEGRIKNIFIENYESQD